ncbi:hypothetical protein T12_2493 [Trichinella patagoniensis]|uniref:Uncharacterized protein n=1 Tax=Trichinella patagoniensis TaxID=990121 RepID=A0A0V0ZN31_9BILA|nr:hypothetical protein T12_2493 [Trichinella patagoniensis]
MATVHFSLLGKKKCRVWTKFVQLLWNNLLLNFVLFLSQYIDLEMPCRKVTGYLFYMNWNLMNYSTTASRQELESFFRTCDRKWSEMSEQEKHEWKLKVQSNGNFEPHKLLYPFLHNVQRGKGQKTRHVPFDHIFQRFENLDDPKFQSMRRHGSSLFLNSVKLSRRNSNLQLSYTLIGVSFSGDTVIDSKFVEVDLLNFSLELGIIKTAGVTIDIDKWSLPLDVKDILNETNYLVCEGLKYSAVAEVMRFIWAKDRSLGIPPQLLLMEDFINTVLLCSEQKNEEDIVLPPLMNCHAVEVQFPIGCSHHTLLSTVDFPCAKEESFIALKEIFRQIANAKPTFLKSDKLLEILEYQRKAQTQLHIESSHQEDDTAMNAFENLPLIDIIPKNTERKLPLEDKMKPIDHTQPVEQYPDWFKYIIQKNIERKLPLEDRMKLIDGTEPVKIFSQLLNCAMLLRSKLSMEEDYTTDMKFYANLFEGPGRYHTNNNKEQPQISFPHGKRKAKSFYGKFISQLDEAAIIFDEDKHEMPALDHSKEKKYEEEFDVYDNEDPKREERIIDYYYETAEYIEKSNEVYSYFNRTATEKRNTYEYEFDGD